MGPRGPRPPAAPDPTSPSARSLFSKEVIADFENGRITPGAGGLLATARSNTLRLKLLKIGARIRETSRRIWVHLASRSPYRNLLALVLQNLRASPS
ncbi:MAG: transposase [Deltaproteobacteria bacterium]|jgi:hypothetical protein